MKSKYLLLLIAFFVAANAHAQNIFPSTGSAGIGTTTPNASSILDMVSTTKGILIPRMTIAQRKAMVPPVATGLLIYQTNSLPGFYYYTGTAWKAMTPKAGWLLTGNAGTDTAANFIGTTDAQPLVFKVNNQKAGYLGTPAIANTAFGYQSLNTNSSGVSNTAIGLQALYANTSGYSNTATGYQALYSNTFGFENTATGYQALYSNTSEGAVNTATGCGALYSNINGQQNTAVGYHALYSTTVSSGNIAIGYYAGDNSKNNGSNNTFIGWLDGANEDGFTNSTALGALVLTTASNQVRIGGNVTSIGGPQNWTTISDGRIKLNIREDVPGLSFIKLLRPVTYNKSIQLEDQIIGRKNKKELSPDNTYEKIRYSGFVAQEVEQAAKKMGYDFSGVDAPKNDKDLYGLRYAEFVVPLVKAVQELSKANDDNEAIIQQQNNKIDDLENRLAKLEAMMNMHQSTTNLSSASLDQNVPNPFSNTTTISYSLPQNFTSAQIIITDKAGKVLKRVNLPAGGQGVSGSGKGLLQLNASAFSSSSYQYSLLVDGKLIDTKQMILAK